MADRALVILDRRTANVRVLDDPDHQPEDPHDFLGRLEVDEESGPVDALANAL